MPIIDSARLASFDLGYYLRFLRGIQEHVYEGDNEGEAEFSECACSLEQAAFILARRVSHVESEQFLASLRSAQNRYGEAIAAGRRFDSLFASFQGVIWERLNTIALRLTADSTLLTLWFEFGFALAATVLHVLDDGGDSIPEVLWEKARALSIELPEADRKIFQAALPEDCDDRAGLIHELEVTRESVRGRLPLMDAGERTDPGTSHEATKVGPAMAAPARGSGRPKRRRDDATEARDEFIYDKYVGGISLATIRNEVGKERGWEPLHTDPAVTRAAQRFAERWGLPRPTFGQGMNHRLQRPGGTD